MKYLVKIKPLEPYSFGNDQGYEYPGEKKMGKISYLATSNLLPEQTTILGMIRNVILQSNFQGYRADFRYSVEDKKQISKIIGERSFCFRRDINGSTKQEFGYIEDLSPLFLMNAAGDVLVPNPFNNVSRDSYKAMEMGQDSKVVSSYGPLILPKEGQYDAKKGHAAGFFNLDQQTVLMMDELFSGRLVAGNRKSTNQTGGNRDNGFFKREVISMADGYCFALTVLLKDDAKVPGDKLIAYMGKKKSAFEISFIEAAGLDIVEKVKSGFRGGEDWYYALSDLYVDQEYRYRKFVITEKRYIRNLMTAYSPGNDGVIGRLKKPKERTFLITKGSVFYEGNPFGKLNENASSIGYNCIVKIGGSN